MREREKKKIERHESTTEEHKKEDRSFLTLSVRITTGYSVEDPQLLYSTNKPGLLTTLSPFSRGTPQTSPSLLPESKTLT